MEDVITAKSLCLHGEIAFLPNCLLFASLPPACAAEAARHALKCAIACTTSCQLIITCLNPTVGPTGRARCPENGLAASTAFCAFAQSFTARFCRGATPRIGFVNTTVAWIWS